MLEFSYRVIRALNRYITFTPEFRKLITREEFIIWAKRYLDYPYVLGGNGNTREEWIDCSHLISRILIDTGCMNPHFYRTARYLQGITQTVAKADVQAWDLLFLWDDTVDHIGHVAIIEKCLWWEQFSVIDASGPSTGIYSTTLREIDTSGERYFVWKPIFFHTS